MNGELTIRGARLVLPGRIVTGDLRIEDGLITALGPSVPGQDGPELDATGLICMPGAIQAAPDLPVDRQADSLAEPTAAAAASGVSSLLLAVSSADALKTALDAAGRNAHTHYGFLVGPEADARAATVVEHARGVYLAHGLGEGEIGASALEDLLTASRSLALVRVAGAVDAVDRVLNIARRTGTRVHLLQVASAEVLQRLRDCASERITGEASAPLLFGATAGDARPLWDGLREGQLTSVGGCAPGWAVLRAIDHAARELLPWTEIARWLAERPAQTFGLHRTGRLEVGFHADLLLIDPRRPNAREPELAGALIASTLDGRLAVREGQLDPEARGRELPARRPS